MRTLKKDLKELYSGNSLDEIINKLGDIEHIEDLLVRFCKDGNEHIARRLVDMALKKSNSLDNYVRFVDYIAKERLMGDKDWALAIYDIAFDKDKNYQNNEILCKSISYPIFLKDQEWEEEIYKYVLGKAKYSLIYANLAESIALQNALNNKEWAKEILTIALSKATDDFEYAGIAKVIASKDSYNDEKWARDIYKVALQKNENLNQLTRIAGSIASSRYINDKKWAKEIYESAFLGITNSSEEEYHKVFLYSELAKSVALEETLNDKEWAKKIYETAINLVPEEDGMHGVLQTRMAEISLVNAKDICEDLLKRAKYLFDYINAAERIISEETLNDREWAKDVYKQALLRVDDIRGYISLANSVSDYLNDEKFLIEIYELAVKKSDSEYSYQEIAEFASMCLTDKTWPKQLYAKAIFKADENNEPANTIIKWKKKYKRIFKEEYIAPPPSKAKIAQDARKDEIISELKKYYFDEDLEDLIDDVINADCFTSFINSVSEHQELVKMTINMLLNQPNNDSMSYTEYAEYAYEFLHDEKWSKELIKVALKQLEEDTENSNNFLIRSCVNISESILNLFKDKKWAKEVYELGVKMASDYDEYCMIADSISDEKYLNDRELAKDIYKLAVKKAQTVNEHIVLARYIIKFDKKWAAEIIKEFIKTINEYESYISISEAILEVFEDEKWGKEIHQLGIDLAVNNNEDEEVLKYIQKEWNKQLKM
ncbi:hypothetical protein FCU45_10900 [Sulfurimonas crateris]|uniref:Uncharacterized protein n=1 Tax=Sulfurimonas crateris TaxID=2574727 RepID=A0A4U2Z525_9BACT|nr:hypothetical protein [Sulfurimonas crateris]TKI68512.1 hypothetical protein FCU45_10900 [Sulfurimonas crateris]